MSAKPLQSISRRPSPHLQFSRDLIKVKYCTSTFMFLPTRPISAILVRETPEGQKPVYFTNKALLGPETRYQKIEMVALALLTSAQRLRQYFLAHTVIVRTDQPIRQILGRQTLRIQEGTEGTNVR
jgi:hypothetical protein